MRRLIVGLCVMLGIFFPNLNTLTEAYGINSTILFEQKTRIITPMQALELVKELYADNFDRVYPETSGDYYYKLPFADYYLVYEGKGETQKDYVFHLYEFVIDDPDTGIGHTVTYGWYTVDNKSGEITDQTQ